MLSQSAPDFWACSAPVWSSSAPFAPGGLRGPTCRRVACGGWSNGRDGGRRRVYGPAGAADGPWCCCRSHSWAWRSVLLGRWRSLGTVASWAGVPPSVGGGARRGVALPSWRPRLC